jgi:hypothetical protein
LSYVVARDYGFAPNPFFGVCTLATCKPNIRRAAQLGDWVIGTGTASRQRKDYLVFAMKVDEAVTFNEYWDDPSFQQKKPNLSGSKKQAFGDNIYFKQSGKWHQLDSHHSFADGTPNPANIENDTQADRVLIGSDYIYWGRSGPKIPARFRNFQGYDICAGRNHKSNFPTPMVEQFIAWLRGSDWKGYIGEPLDWSRTP